MTCTAHYGTITVIAQAPVTDTFDVVTMPKILLLNYLDILFIVRDEYMFNKILFANDGREN